MNDKAPVTSWAGTIFSSDLSYVQSTNQDKIWIIQSKIIREIAEKESCVIVGRCADSILEGKADLLKVFIYADFDSRAKRIVERYGETEVPTEKRLRDKDKRRAMYYQFYTDQEWGKVENYHISLDSSALGIEKCVDIISSLY
jgi:cytidylate kinase